MSHGNTDKRRARRKIGARFPSFHSLVIWLIAIYMALPATTARARHSAAGGALSPMKVLPGLVGSGITIQADQNIVRGGSVFVTLPALNLSAGQQINFIVPQGTQN